MIGRSSAPPKKKRLPFSGALKISLPLNRQSNSPLHVSLLDVTSSVRQQFEDFLTV